jgi:O-antigen/teichoic acid export membrane protein
VRSIGQGAMKSAGAAERPRTYRLKILRTILNDALYRGSLYLLVNTVATSAIGFLFWTLAAHRYSATTVGVFSSVTSGASLLAAIAALGLPITMTRHIVGAENPRGLLVMAAAIIGTVGTALCLVTVLFLGPHLPLALHIRQHGRMAVLVTTLVVFTAIGTTFDAGLVATRSTRVVLIKNLIGSITKLVAMLLLASYRSSGLLIAFGLGLVLATAVCGVTLFHGVGSKGTEPRPFRMPWQYLSMTSGNYFATVIGILPLSIVPIEVLAVRGPAQTARFSIAFLVAGFLNFIPSTMGQVLFAEIARGGQPLGQQLRKALRAVYGLLLPCLTLMIIAAPFILRLFGAAYASEATDCLRVLALSALPAGGTYLVDAFIIARDRLAAYTFMQVANAVLVLGGVGILLPRGLTAAASGWALAQVLTLVLGVLVLATSRAGRHHPKISGPAPSASRYYQRERQTRPGIYAFEPQIRELLATWPMMPTTLIAERIGWDRSIQVLLERVTELRLGYSRAYQHSTQDNYRAGDVAQCGLWFPPIEIPVGFGQVRPGKELPVLTMITGYSRWLCAMIIPSRSAQDLFAGWWELIAELGGVPRMLACHSEDAIGRWTEGGGRITAECQRFCDSLRTTVVLGRFGDPATSGLIERAHAYMESSFLRGRTFTSPDDFNIQLRAWLTETNTRIRKSPDHSPASLIVADRNAMLPLPPTPPRIGWRLSVRIADRPFVLFDTNEYAVEADLIGRAAELLADLNHVRVLCDGKLRAKHDRAWARGQVIGDPSH